MEWFFKSQILPKSIYDNISYGPKIHGKGETKSELDQIVENSLKKSALWEEVKDRLDEPGQVYLEDSNKDFV